MIEKFTFITFRTRLPINLGSLQHGERTHYISTSKGERILDRTVHVAFGCKMDNTVYLILLHQRKYGIEITDIRLNKSIIWSLLDILQIGQVSGIGQFVEIDDMIVRVFRDEKPYDM